MLERRTILQTELAQLELVNTQLQAVETRNARLAARAEELLAAARGRTRWLRVLDEIRHCLGNGMWLVSLAPAEHAAPVRARRAAPAAVQPAEQGGGPVTHLRLKGLLFLDQEEEKSAVVQLRDRLRESPLFTEKTEIELAPPITPDDYAREFTILVELRAPL
jgi:Tfp pilus assembly protein PilN